MDLFVIANKVEKALEDRNAAPCLAWCHEHKSRLRKLKVFNFYPKISVKFNMFYFAD